jgi:hypothetical protein
VQIPIEHMALISAGLIASYWPIWPKASTGLRKRCCNVKWLYVLKYCMYCFACLYYRAREMWFLSCNNILRMWSLQMQYHLHAWTNIIKDCSECLCSNICPQKLFCHLSLYPGYHHTKVDYKNKKFEKYICCISLVPFFWRSVSSVFSCCVGEK